MSRDLVPKVSSPCAARPVLTRLREIIGAVVAQFDGSVIEVEAVHDQVRLPVEFPHLARMPRLNMEDHKLVKAS